MLGTIQRPHFLDMLEALRLMQGAQARELCRPGRESASTPSELCNWATRVSHLQNVKVITAPSEGCCED